MDLLSWLAQRLARHDVPAFLGAQAAALLAASVVLFARLRAPSVGLRARPALAVVGSAALGTLLGAALLGVALRLPTALRSGSDPFAPGHLTAYGALLGAAMGTAAGARVVGLAVATSLDALAPALGALVALGRLGCALAGCCHGPIVSNALGVAYPSSSPAFADQLERGLVETTSHASLPVLPVALLESGIGLAMVALGRRRFERPGARLAAVAALYAVGRFGLELLRADARPHAGPLSVPQGLSLLVLGGVMWFAAGGARSRA